MPTRLRDAIGTIVGKDEKVVLYEGSKHVYTGFAMFIPDIYMNCEEEWIVNYSNRNYTEITLIPKKSEKVSIEVTTMAKIQELLIQSRLEYWTYYDPEEKTHLIRFGKDLNVE